MKGVPEEEEEAEDDEGEVWSSLTTAPPKLPNTLVIQAEHEEEEEDPWGGIPEPPDGGWGWVIVAASFLCNVVVDGVAYSFGIFLIHFVDYYKAPKGKVAWIGSLLSGCYLSAGPVVSALTNKFGCRPVTISGSILSCIAFLFSTFAPSVDFLMVTHGIMAGIGFGLIYLPAIVSVGYYFSTKRAFATGIAVCGSGMGAFIFAPLTQFLLETYDWKGALLIVAGFALNCAVFGALMRPLEAAAPKTKQAKSAPISNETKEKGDSGLVLLAEDSVKVPLINTEPGVQSTLNLDQVPKQSTLLPGLTTEENMRNSVDAVPGLVVTEAPTGSNGSTQHVDGASLGTLVEGKPVQPALLKIIPSHINMKDLQRRFTMPATMPVSSTNTLCPTSNNNYEVQRGPRGESWSAARRQQRRMSNRKDLARPLYRKDIFYSGSIVNLPQYRQSKADIRTYMASVTTIPREESDNEDGTAVTEADKKRPMCPKLPKSMSHTLKEVLDFSLLRQRAFLLTCIANVLGMMGFFIPFVYITDSSIEKGIGKDPAAFLLSIIGMTNLIGRLMFGWFVDKTGIKALNVNNLCLVISGIAIFTVPFCYSYGLIVTACIFFSFFVSAYMSLTSIILVEMVGLDKLTNSFGLLCLFRGAAVITGPPLAGSIYDWTGSYDIPFYLAGALLIISGLSMFMIPWITKSSPAVEIRPPTPPDDGDSGKPESEPITAL